MKNFLYIQIVIKKMPKTKNVNVKSIKKIIKPKKVINKLPLSKKLSAKIVKWRQTISNIIAK